MDVEDDLPINAVTISPEQLESFYQEIEKIPSSRVPIDGKAARLAYEFMEDTGLRVTELIHVKVKDINLTNRILTVTMPKVSRRCKCSRWKNKNEYSQAKVLEYADPLCSVCHGRGRWKKPQRTTISPRIWNKVTDYISKLGQEDRLFPVSRNALWEWAEKAGRKAGLNISIIKKDKTITNMFNHFFRALCTIRMKRDAKNDDFKDELIMCKRRDTYDTHVDRYTEIDINYLLAWEEKTYGNLTNN